MLKDYHYRNALALMATGFILMVIGLAPVFAADLPQLPGYSTATPKISGGYISAGAGYAYADTKALDFTLASKGAIGDLRLGYDFQLPKSKFVVGVLGGVGASDIGTSSIISPEQSWNWYVGGRAGYMFNRSDLVYLIGTFRSTDFKVSAGDLGSVSKTLAGASYGAGMEFWLDNHVTLGVEATRTDYGNVSISGVKVDNSDYNGTVRLGYKF